MNRSTVEIHEFSTGINPQQTADGGWVSLGFTGKYMNGTIDPIPSVVERAIANREFAVTEKASSDQPAIIGRVLGSEEKAWSVVAVVTRGKDEKGRSISVYRYFLCKGANHLWKILAWFESQGMPRFNPFDTRVIGQPTLYVARGQGSESLKPDLSLDTSEPTLLSPGQYNVQDLNRLAIKKANNKNNSQPVSWAFNVEALEQPRRFQVIQPASDRAFRILENVIANAPKVATPIGADEQALKGAIKSLMNSSQVKPEAVQALTEALGNDKITSEYWHSLFDGQGAKAALSQKIQSPRLLRLVTLRAMVIPETLPEFLDWLNIKGGRKKLDDNQTNSLKFQSVLRNLFPKDKLASGIKFLLPKLLEKQITPEAVHWLLIKKESAWVSCRNQLISDIKADLEFIDNYFNPPQRTLPQSVPSQRTLPESSPQQQLSLDSASFRCGKEIWQDLIRNWERIQAGDPSPYYQPFADLFEQFEQLRNSQEYQQLSAYFYQVSDGIVPKRVFTVAFPDRRLSSDRLTFLGLTLQREITIIERGWILFSNYFEYIAIISLLSLIALGGGFMVASILKSGQVHTDEAKISNSELENAIKEENFNTTVGSLKGLIKRLKLELAEKERINPQQKKQEIRDAVVESLCVSGSKCLNSDFIEKYNSEDSQPKILEKWVKQIYNYQRQKSLSADGIIENGNNTIRSLEEDVRIKLGIQSADYHAQAEQNPVESKPNLGEGMTPQQKEEALKLFDQTRQVILGIVTELQADPELQGRLPQDKREDAIKQAFKDVLLDPKLNYAGAILSEGKPEDRKYSETQWVEAIYAYQEKENPNNAFGYIRPRGQTYPKLKQDVKDSIINSTPQPGQKPDGRG